MEEGMSRWNDSITEASKILQTQEQWPADPLEAPSEISALIDISKNVAGVGRQPLGAYSILKKVELCLFLCFVDLMFQDKEKWKQAWACGGEEGRITSIWDSSEISLCLGNSTLTPEEGGAEPPHNVWLYSWFWTICSSGAASSGTLQPCSLKAV